MAHEPLKSLDPKGTILLMNRKLRCSSSRSSGICGIGRDSFLLASIRVERFAGVIADGLDNTKAFRSALSKQYPITHSEELWTLHKAEGHSSTIASSDICSINVDDCTCLRNGADVQHSLVFRLDGGCVAENEDFGDKLAMDLGWLVVIFE